MSEVMKNETIGVLLPVYIKDRPEYLKLAIDSILDQSYYDIKLFIGVDGPISEELSNIIDDYSKKERVRVIRFEKNRGLAMVLNDLLIIADEDGLQFFARMDADDISVPDRLEKQLKYLRDHPEVDVVGGAVAEINEKGEYRNKTIIFPETHAECIAFFAKRNPHAHPAVMFRRSFFEKAGCMYRPEYRQNQDTMLWLDGIKKGTKHANIPDIVLKFRFTDTLFKKRRNGWSFAKKQLQDRLQINKSLGYGLSADIFGYLMFGLLISPPWIKKIAYKIFR